jgi:hypothetical protein
MLGIVPQGFGDIEVAFECEDGKRIAAILEQSSHASTDSVMAQQALKHRFKNLDGGADAFFHVLSTGGSATVIVERSDEGALEFLLSFDDAAKFAQSLKSVCSTPPHQMRHSALDG